VRVVRNRSERGRTGKPGAANLGVCLARGEVVVVLDADSTIDLATCWCATPTRTSSPACR
jgi:hypothetical protein